MKTTKKTFESPRFAVTVRSDPDTFENVVNQHYRNLTTNRLSDNDKQTASKNLGYVISDNKIVSPIASTTFRGFPSFQFLIRGSTVNDGISEYGVPEEDHQYIWFESNKQFFLLSFTKTNTMTQILSTFKIVEQNGNATTKQCANADIKFSLSIPSDWTCETQENAGAGWIKITSSVFEIDISALGRGPFCNPGEDDPQSPRYDPTHACQTVDFYSKNSADIKLYTLNKQNKEIFGVLSAASAPWISIKWKNMESVDLTVDQKNQLINVLNSVQLLP